MRGKSPSSRRWNRRRQLGCESLEPRQVLSALPLISEFVASNAQSLLDGDGNSSDWIELTNAGDQPIDLAGWYLTDRNSDLLRWAIPDDAATTLDPSEFLVVFASGQNRDDYVDPLGYLHTNFSLRADGETLALVQPDGETIVSQFAPDGSDFPPQVTDVSYGLMEVAGEYSPNAPVYFTMPSPGAPNLGGAADLGPNVRKVTDRPEQPTENDPLVIEATVTPTRAALDRVELLYRVMFNAETTLAMRDDGIARDRVAGDGVFTTVIPSDAYGPGEMVRWRVEAFDTSQVNTHMPLLLDPDDSPEYFGTVVLDIDIDSNLPVLHWFTNDPAGANERTGSRGSVFYEGRFYDNVLFDLHGQSTAGFPKKSYDIDFNSGDRFEWRAGEIPVKDINLLSNWADKSNVRNTISYAALAASGSPYHFAFPVRVEQNGEFFSVADMVEDGDDRYLERVGLDPNGALYKMYNTGNSATGNVEKKTRQFEGNDDLQQLINGAQLTGEARTQFLFDNINIPEAINYLAGHVLVSNTDCCHKNYYFYRDTEGTGEWQFLPWDVDLTEGHNWISQFGYFDDRLFPTNGLFVGSNNTVMNALFSTPEIREMYLRRIRTLMEEIIQPPGTPRENRFFENMIDALVEQIDPHDDADPQLGTDDADLDYQRWGSWGDLGTMRESVDRLFTEYLEPRREFLFGPMTVEQGGQIPAQQAADSVVQFGAIDFAPVSGIAREAFVQLMNPSAAAIDISGWRVSGDMQHTFAPGTVISAGGSLYVALDSNAFRARLSGAAGGQGLFVQQADAGVLSTLGGELRIEKPTGGRIAELVYGAGRSDVQQTLRITEIDYHPAPATAEESAAGYGDESGFEFIELQNIGNAPLDLTGVRFISEDGKGLEFDFSTSAVASLQPGEFVLLVARANAFTVRHGAGLPIAGEFVGGLSNGGEQLTLVDAGGGIVADFQYDDAGDWPGRADGFGSSLEVIDAQGDFNTPENWRSSGEYAGSPGFAGAGPSRDVVVNEVIANSDATQFDAIELINTTGQPIDIGGWYLSDSSADYRKFRIPDGTVIAAGGYQVFDERDFNAAPLSDHSAFALNGEQGDDVWLLAADAAGRLDRFVDHIDFGGSRPDTSLGRSPNGTGKFLPLRAITLAAANAPHRLPELLISELHVNPSAAGAEGDLEFIEIYNATGSKVDLAGWRLRGGVDLDFAAGTSIEPFSTLVVLSFNPEKKDAFDRLVNESRTDLFLSRFGIDGSVAIVGGYSGRLNKAGDKVRLERLLEEDDVPMGESAYVLVDSVSYSSTQSQSVAAAEPVASLNRNFVNQQGDEAAAWIAADPTPGNFHGTASTFEVLSVDARDNYLDIRLLNDLDELGLNLYDGYDASFDFPDAEVLGEATGPVSGSLIYREAERLLRFVPTGGPLPPDRYTLRLISGSEALVDQAGNLLDGDGDLLAGGDFEFQWRVAPSIDRIFSVPDFARGPSQFVRLGDTGGLPISINNGDGVTDFELYFQYDPGKLLVLSIGRSPDLPAGWRVDTVEVVDAGKLRITASGPTALPLGVSQVLSVVAVVSPSATVGTAQMLQIANPRINQGAIPASGDAAVQVVGYFGDASGEGGLSGLDASLIARTVVGLDTGFDAFDQIDPLIVADVTGNGRLSALDASFVARKAVGLDQPEIPSDLVMLTAMLPTQIARPIESELTDLPPGLNLAAYFDRPATAEANMQNAAGFKEQSLPIMESQPQTKTTKPMQSPAAITQESGDEDEKTPRDGSAPTSSDELFRVIGSNDRL